MVRSEKRSDRTLIALSDEPEIHVEISSRSVESEYFDTRSNDELDGEENHKESKQSKAELRRQENLRSRNWLRRFRQRCGDAVNNEWVQLVIIFLIVVNALTMGVATFPAIRNDPDRERAFEIVDMVFLSIFSVESGMQLFYRGWRLFLDGWLTFDFLIVVLSWSFNALQVIRAFRIFRAFRLITRIKVLKDLVIAIGAVLPRMGAISLLLMLVFYIYSVLFTSLFKDLELENNNFRTLDKSLFSCFEMMTLEWADVSREVMAVHSWAWAPFVSFIMLSGFIVFNLIIAVVCDAVAMTDSESRLHGEHEETPEEKLTRAQVRIKALGAQIDAMHEKQKSVHDMLEELAEAVGASDPLVQNGSALNLSPAASNAFK